MEEEFQFEPPISDSPVIPIFLDETEEYHQEEITSRSSLDLATNRVEVNAIATVDILDSNSMSLGLPDSLLTAEDVWREQYFMIQGPTSTEQTSEHNDPADITINVKGSESLEEVQIYPSETVIVFESHEQSSHSQRDTNPPRKVMNECPGKKT